jgi:hypothetical protein
MKIFDPISHTLEENNIFLNIKKRNKDFLTHQAASSAVILITSTSI